MLKKLAKAAVKNDELKSVVGRILNKSVIEGNLDILKKVINDGKNNIHKLFKDEAVVFETMNPYLVSHIVKAIVNKSPKMVYDEKIFPKLISVLLLLPIIFKDDSDFIAQPYICLYKLFARLDDESDKIERKAMVNLMTEHQLLKSIFSKFFSFSFISQTIHFFLMNN